MDGYVTAEYLATIADISDSASEEGNKFKGDFFYLVCLGWGYDVG